MAKFILVKNGNTVVGIYDTPAEIRQAALDGVDKNPSATYYAAKLIRKVSAEKIPPSYTVVEEDLEGVQ